MENTFGFDVAVSAVDGSYDAIRDPDTLELPVTDEVSRDNTDSNELCDLKTIEIK
jgi:hypothetical protein